MYCTNETNLNCRLPKEIMTKDLRHLTKTGRIVLSNLSISYMVQMQSWRGFPNNASHCLCAAGEKDECSLVFILCRKGYSGMKKIKRPAICLARSGESSY